MDFVNALAFSKGEMLKHLQDFFVNFTNVNALARAQSNVCLFSLHSYITTIQHIIALY